MLFRSETATFFDTHCEVGLPAALEPAGLARKIPLDAVMRMMLLGSAERMSAARAKEVGLVGEADLRREARLAGGKDRGQARSCGKLSRHHLNLALKRRAFEGRPKGGKVIICLC